MKKTILFLAVSLYLQSICFAETVSLTKEQFENMAEINKALVNKYPQYRGMSGSQEKMEIHGISAESFKQEVSKLSFDDIKSDKVRNKTDLIGKLKTLGLNDDEINLLNLRSE